MMPKPLAALPGHSALKGLAGKSQALMQYACWHAAGLGCMMADLRTERP